METTFKVRSLTFDRSRTYLLASLFIAGNLVLPQLCHLIPGGGPMLLPIYFFTLVASYKYGLRVGLLAAVLSPVLNSLLFSMPAVAVLPAILVKSSLLAVAAAYAGRRFSKANLAALVFVVLAYQVVGTAIEWLISGSFTLALQDFRVGVPGMFLQVLGGFGVLRLFSKD